MFYIYYVIISFKASLILMQIVCSWYHIACQQCHWFNIIWFIYLFLYFACKCLWLLLKIAQVWRYQFDFWAHYNCIHLTIYLIPCFLCASLEFLSFFWWGIVGYHTASNLFTLLLWTFNEECAFESSKSFYFCCLIIALGPFCLTSISPLKEFQ